MSSSEKPQNKFPLGKNAIVIGSSSGIGFECVKALLENGIKNVIMSSIVEVKEMEEDVQKLKEKYSASNLQYIKCDISKYDEVEDLFKETLKLFGSLDTVVNCAGIFNEESVDKTIDINLKGIIYSTQLGLKFMTKENGGQGGSIVNVASEVAFSSMRAAPLYAASKYGVIGYTRSISLPYHYDKTSVRIMALCPGYTDTPLVTSKQEVCKSGNANPLLLLWLEDISTLTSQEALYPALCLIKMLKEGEPGSIWLAQDKEMYEIEIPYVVRKNQ